MKKILTKPTITVITPSYNQSTYLEQAIQSVINQNYSSIEYIIIDGGSTDGSVEVLERYAKYITYWISEKDTGQSEAINKGLRLARGEIVCWLNSDDLFESNALNKVSQFFMDNVDANFVYGDGVIFHQNRIKPDSYCVPGKIDQSILRRCDPLQQPSTFWRRKIHDEVGFIDESLFYTMDWDFFMRVALKYDLYYLPASLSRYRIHDAHKTGLAGERRSKEILNFIKKYGDPQWISIYTFVYTYADEIRHYRHKFGWRIGRVLFFIRHPRLVITCGLSIIVAMNMY